jgi:hypothetical protein
MVYALSNKHGLYLDNPRAQNHACAKHDLTLHLEAHAAIINDD